MDRQQRIVARLTEIIADLFGIETNQVDTQQSFMDMGADSMFLLQAVQRVESEFSISIPFRDLLDKISHIEALALYIDGQIAPQQSPTPTVDFTVSKHGNVVEQTIASQLQLMSQQLELLRKKVGHTTSTQTNAIKNQQQQLTRRPSLETKRREASPKPARGAFNLEDSVQFSPLQQQFMQSFIERYNKRTGKSKQHTKKYKHYLADKRTFGGFALFKKEIVYPIVGKSSSGSKIWDIDDNEYIDISMGFGVHLFGHAPEFLQSALQNQIKAGSQIGPQSYMAGEVAQGICELTKTERVTFCNSGTEAVMTALRLARATTGRRKIVMFTYSYHGAFDGVLCYSSAAGKTFPIAPGIPINMVNDMIVLEYGDPKSLEFIRQSNDLAAVLVEPIQSRRPNLQPEEFLQQLRQITKESNTMLIFDEVLVGFRLHPGGAQAWFNIKADIVTYGKIIGGGLPIGVVAGKSECMDGIDGGLWKYGDQSYPEKITTFFGGTFNKNPLTMATAHAVIQHIKEHGQKLYDELNARTDKFAQELNDYFSKNQFPLRIAHTASLFRFVPADGTVIIAGYPPELDLFYYLMIDKGIYIWEGRICFFSTAHTDEDIAKVIQAVKDTVEELRLADFLTPPMPGKDYEKLPGSEQRLVRYLSDSISDSFFRPTDRKTNEAANSWVTYRRALKSPKLRLFCFPYAGGGASIFRTWAADLPEEVEVCPIQLPGRENRINEQPYTSMEALVEEALSELQILMGVPYAFFGYSMGALIAFELAVKLRQHKLAPPVKLFVAGQRAPELHDAGPPVRDLPDAEMLEILQKDFYIPEEILQNEEMKSLMIPLIRADSALCETYTYQEVPPLECDIFAFGGMKDSYIKVNEIEAWAKYTTKTFNMQMFAGDHFFIHSSYEQMLRTITNELRGDIS